MADSVGAAANAMGAARRRAHLWALERDHAIWGAATLAAWTHTIDEMRIGELVAVPFGLLNAALVAVWPRLSTRSRAGASIACGLFWGLAAIPYHVAPLVAGHSTWQNFSGLTRVVAGLTMVGLGATIARGRHRDR